MHNTPVVYSAQYTAHNACIMHTYIMHNNAQCGIAIECMHAWLVWLVVGGHWVPNLQALQMLYTKGAVVQSRARLR